MKINFTTTKLNQKESVTTIDFKGKAESKDTNRFIFFELPYLSNGTDEWNPGLLSEKRELPLKIPITLEESYEYSLTTPQGFRLLTPLTNIEFENNAGSVFIGFNMEKDGKLSVKRYLYLSKEIIEPADYPELLRLVHAWDNQQLRRLVFIKD